MPRELVAVAPSTPVLQRYEVPPLGERQIRIRTEFASPKHGTEMVGYRQERAFSNRYDPELGCMVPLSEAEVQQRFPLPLGNMAAGVVTEVGEQVSRFQPGDRVFGHFPVREIQTVDESNADLLPEGLSAEAAVCLDPAVMALAMRDAKIQLGDHVAVFGLGAIGLMAVQLARLAGADKVVAVDPIAIRRKVALQLGADVAFDPLADGDPILELRKGTGPNTPELQRPAPVRIVGGYWERPTQYNQRGVDVAIEVSGNVRALHQAIRATRYGGTICMLSYYGSDAAGVYLGNEFHVNSQQIISARVESLPLRQAPAWTLARLVEVALSWLQSGRLRTEGIVTPIVPFSEAAAAYRMIDEDPASSVKLGIRFD